MLSPTPAHSPPLCAPEHMLTTPSEPSFRRSQRVVRQHCCHDKKENSLCYHKEITIVAPPTRPPVAPVPAVA